MLRSVVFLYLCVMASATTVPQHVLDMFENETLQVNETNETILLILAAPTPTPPKEPETKEPETKEPTLAPGDTSAPTTLAPTPAPAPQSKVTVTMEVASAANFDLDAFKASLSDAAGGNVTGATYVATFKVEMTLSISGTSVAEADMIKTVAGLLEVAESLVTVSITETRRLSDARRLASTVVASAESADASVIDAAKAKADTGISDASILTKLKEIDSGTYASAAVTVTAPPKVSAMVEIVQTVADAAAGDALGEAIKNSAEALAPTDFGATTIAAAAVTEIQTAFPTPAPPTPASPTAAPPTTASPTAAPNTTTAAAPEEESGASLERAGLLTVAMVALTTVVGMQ